MAAKAQLTRRSSTLPEREGAAPILTLKISGPGVRMGRIPVPDLIKICQEAQNAVTRQAEALQGRKTVHPGPASIGIRQDCTLELAAIGEGSTILAFDVAKPRSQARTLGVKAVEELVSAVHSLGNGGKKRDIDQGVLRSIYALGGLIDKRITSLVLTAPGNGADKARSGKPTSARITAKVRDRAAIHLSRPTQRFMQLDGVLEMADFGRKERRCRIDPAIGAPVTCSFGVELENVVQRRLRSPVRVKGLAKIPPHSVRVEILELESIEPLPALFPGENFFASYTIGQLAAAQGVEPLKNALSLAGIIDDDEVEEFIGGIYRARERVRERP